jgi:hypothetical protein
MMDELTDEQREAKENVEDYFRKAKVAAEKKMKERGMKLAAYIPEEVERMDFEDLLSTFMDKGRLGRAKGISDKEIRIEEISDSSVKASIRNYHFLVDIKNRVILHDCADWSRCAPAKQFCKHVGKVMMTIPTEKAREIMKQIALEREKWEFKPYST